VAEPLAASAAFASRHGERQAPAAAAVSAGFAFLERTSVALASVIARRGQAPEASIQAGEELGLMLPVTPTRVTNGAIAFAWAGPGRWLAECAEETGERLLVRLRGALGNVAAVSDQSDGRAILRIRGAQARNVLAKGLPVDTHPSVMQPGAVVLSVIGHIGVHLWQVDDAPTYDCVVARSYARDFLKWIEVASAEYRQG
jgi:sarcosine oxidase subunit gamma